MKNKKNHEFKIGVIPKSYIKHDRAEKSIIKSESLDLKERKYKVEYANPVRKDFEDQFPKKIRLARRSIFKNRLILRSSKLKGLNKHLKMLLRIQEEILNSREVTSKPGAHFLRINE